MKPPLADRCRPQTFDKVVGQKETVAFLQKTIESGKPLSIILWGPPGCGKTTLATLYAKAFGAQLLSFSAVLGGLADLRKVIAQAQQTPLLQTVLFVDEIHRFNKAQQDAFLPHVERGTITLVGATTENPSFSLNDALLSRTRVLQLNPLSESALNQLIDRYGKVDDKQELVKLAQGDGRYLYNLLENLEAGGTLQKRAALYDRHGDGHFNLISALHKSVRGSDPDAALYWFARMIEGGEDPLYIARRLIRMASEDIGLADPEALKLCIAARDAYQMLGTPEGELAIAEAVIYVSLAPKSNAIYTAYKAARQKAKETSQMDPPKHILNAPTQLMKQQGYGAGYAYDHDSEAGCSGQSYFPEGVSSSFYKPVARGFEREMQKRLEYFSKFKDL